MRGALVTPFADSYTLASGRNASALRMRRACPRRAEEVSLDFSPAGSARHTEWYARRSPCPSASSILYYGVREVCTLHTSLRCHRISTSAHARVQRKALDQAPARLLIPISTASSCQSKSQNSTWIGLPVLRNFRAAFLLANTGPCLHSPLKILLPLEHHGKTAPVANDYFLPL